MITILHIKIESKKRPEEVRLSLEEAVPSSSDHRRALLTVRGQ